MPASSPDTVVDHPSCVGCAEQLPRGAGCRVVEADGDTPLDAFLARTRCVLKDHLRGFARRYLSQRPRSLLEPEDLVHEVAGQLLSERRRREGAVATSLPGFLAYLRRAAVHCAIDAERRERGRVRCGNCQHYGAWWGVCLAAEHVWTRRPLPAGCDPRRLEPPCERYQSRRIVTELDPAVAARELADAGPGDGQARGDLLHEALVGLAEADPRAALVVRAHLLEGLAYEDLVAPGLSLRTLKRSQARGLAWLRNWLEARGLDVSEEGP